jgi:hypothetical protein
MRICEVLLGERIRESTEEMEFNNGKIKVDD